MRLDPIALNWVFGALSAVGIAFSAGVTALWVRGEKRTDQTIQALREQVLSGERERTQLQTVAVEKAEAYAKLKGEFKATVVALNRAQVYVDPSASIGGVELGPDSQEPTGVFHVAGHHARRYFLGERGEREWRERERQQSLNPTADRKEAERARGSVLDRPLQNYLSDKNSSAPPSK